MLWLIAAMVDGSVGYYTPRAAEMQVERFLGGRNESYAERTMCIYNCDLALEILSDVRYFLMLEEIDEDKVRKVVEFVRKWCEINAKDWAKSKTISMTYPTIVTEELVAGTVINTG